MILAAVKQDGNALEHASESCKRDREVVLMAAAQDPTALGHASDELLQDPMLAAEEDICIIKVTMMSGRSCCIALHREEMTCQSLGGLLPECCTRLGITHRDGIELLYGSQTVPRGAFVSNWPGHPSLASVTEYQLLVAKQPRHA
eukprot:6296409-Amphidinium_carterae.1